MTDKIKKWLAEKPVRLGAHAGVAVQNDHLESLIDERDRFREALEKVAAHGCCVMHNDDGCPGCTASDALKGGG